MQAPSRLVEIARTSDALRQALDGARSRGQHVGLVPTMGALHAGHMQLAREAKRRASYTALSIFVNPTQFGPNEDLGRYPRDLDGDLKKCADAGVDVVFAPEPVEMYPPGDATRVRVPDLADVLCGPFRPGHFEGVATVVAKLFALSAPCVAVFGRKDYQQLRIVERLAKDLLFAVEVVGVPTVREPDGLALSSRNAYLTPEERLRAGSIPVALAKAWTAFARGERRVEALRGVAAAHLASRVTRIDYVSVADPERLATIDDRAELTAAALLAIAVWIGKTRLIDNVVLGEDPSPIGNPP